MKLLPLSQKFKVIKLPAQSKIADLADWPRPYFLAHSDSELSLTIDDSFDETIFGEVAAVEGDWVGWYFEGQLEFSMVGVIAKISGILAAAEISLMAQSTFDTDYIFVKSKDARAAIENLKAQGYVISAI